MSKGQQKTAENRAEEIVIKFLENDMLSSDAIGEVADLLAKGEPVEALRAALRDRHRTP